MVYLENVRLRTKHCGWYRIEHLAQRHHNRHYIFAA